VVGVAILHLARWLAFQLGENDEPLTHPPARITVFSSDPAPDGEAAA